MNLTVNFLGKNTASVTINDEEYPGDSIVFSLVRPDDDKKPDEIHISHWFEGKKVKERKVKI